MAAMAPVPDSLQQIIRPSAQSRWILPQLSAITPTYIESALRGAFVGGNVQSWELFDLMEDTWPRLAKNLNEIKNAVVAMDWHLESWHEDGEACSPAAAERCALVSNAVWRMKPKPDLDENNFGQTVYDLADAFGKGCSVLEVLWEIRHDRNLGDITVPRATQWVHPVNYAWTQEGRLGLRTEVMGTDAGRYSLRTTSYTPGRMAIEPFPEDQFLISIQKARTGPALTAGRLRALAWWWCAANFSADWLMNLAQVFGLPVRWANYPTGAAQSTVNAISDMLENMGSAGWAAFPEGTNLTLHTPGSLGTMSPQADLLDRADTNCDLLILGQTLTSEMPQTGSFAAAKVHEGVKGEVIQALANSVAGVLNDQLIPSILRLNYGDEEECPRFEPKEKLIEDMKANADRDAILLAAGVQMPKAWFYERHEIPIPQPGEEVIEKSAPMANPYGQPGQQSQQDSMDQQEPSDTGDTEDQADDSEDMAAKESRTNKVTSDALRLVSAIADDMKPLRDRIERILSIQNPDILNAKLAEFQKELPQILKDINQDPNSAKVLEGLMHRAFLKGLKT
jgi:phage gp29-like protein